MSPGHSGRVTKAMALSDSALCKRYTSSYETSSSSSSPSLPAWKRYQGMSELILDTNIKEDKIGAEDTNEDEGHGLDDGGHRLDDEGHGLDDEGRRVKSDGLGLEEEDEVVLEGRGSGSVPEPERPEKETTLTTWIDPKDVFVDPKSFTQADGAQSSRVPVPLPEDPYEAIRQAYLVWTNTESEPFEGKVMTPESPHIVAPPTCHIEESKESGTSSARSTSSDSTAPLLPDHLLTHTTPALVPILRRTTRMFMRVPPTMSPGLSTGIAEMVTMFDSAFRKRFRSPYDSSPSLTLLVQKRYRGKSELILGADSKEDREVEESSDSNSKSEGVEDERPTANDEDPVARDKGLAAGVEGPGVNDKSYGLDDESYGLDDESHSVDDESRVLDDEGWGVEIDGLGLKGEEEAIPGGQQQAAPVVRTNLSAPLGHGYEALRHRGLALEGDHVYSTFEVRQGSSSVPEPERSKRVTTCSDTTFTRVDVWFTSHFTITFCCGLDDESYALDDESHGVDDESRGFDNEGRGVEIDGLSLEGEEEALPEAPPLQTPPLPEWTPSSLPISPSHSVVPLPVSSPMIPLIVPSLIASYMATSTATIPVDEDQFIEVGAQLELYRSIPQDHTQRLDSMPPTLFAEIDRHERTVMTFGALWRPVLALEAWAGLVDTRMTDMSWTGYDDHRLVYDMLLQQTALQREL
nr:hypothetical protein [Tanacetum cinerariifolium]